VLDIPQQLPAPGPLQHPLIPLSLQQHLLVNMLERLHHHHPLSIFRSIHIQQFPNLPNTRLLPITATIDPTLRILKTHIIRQQPIHLLIRHQINPLNRLIEVLADGFYGLLEGGEDGGAFGEDVGGGGGIVVAEVADLLL
jgi:hypothetical protein